MLFVAILPVCFPCLCVAFLSRFCFAIFGLSVPLQANNKLERLLSEMTYNVLMRPLNPTRSLTNKRDPQPRVIHMSISNLSVCISRNMERTLNNTHTHRYTNRRERKQDHTEQKSERIIITVITVNLYSTFFVKRTPNALRVLA